MARPSKVVIRKVKTLFARYVFTHSYHRRVFQTLKPFNGWDSFYGSVTASCGCSKEASSAGKEGTTFARLKHHCCNAEQLMALAMSIDPRTSPIRPGNLSVFLTFIMAKDT